MPTRFPSRPVRQSLEIHAQLQQDKVTSNRQVRAIPAPRGKRQTPAQTGSSHAHACTQTHVHTHAHAHTHTLVLMLVPPRHTPNVKGKYSCTFKMYTHY